MASSDGQTRSRPVAIAPAPANGANGGSSQLSMGYTCQTCAKRKVKCDKAAPSCSTCRRAKLECLYQAPPPRLRKRKLSGDVLERLARYERILHQHGLLDADTSPSVGETPQQEPISLHWGEPEPSGKGKLLAAEGKSRYIDGSLWRNFGDDEMQRVSDDEEEDDQDDSAGLDPLTGAFMGSQQSIRQYHPAHTNAMVLWATYVDVVEPICKILHIPSTAKMVEMASQQPALASRTAECLLFAIYHFAVFSLTEEECVEKLGHSRATLMQQYHFATRQALVNASFLKTTEMSVLQSLVLFLIPCRYFYDSHTYWILTGVAVRIAQRMGLPRDGEKLGLPPFEVQMRRRLFFQLLPLEGIASQLSGSGMPIIPDDWDMQQPLNINDDQIWPGMTEAPQEQKGATDMIFCLSRSCIGKFFARAGKPVNGTGSGPFKNYQEAERVISEAETEVEEKYIRYCDIVNPLHFLTIGLARSGITAMRLRIRLPKVRNQTATDAERRELMQLAQKIMDTDAATCAHDGLKKYRWHVRPFFLWGTWDALILVLTTLWTRGDLLAPTEANAAWIRVEKVYHNHDELLESKRALYVAFGRLTLKAWLAHPPSSGTPEPAFITALKSPRKAKSQSRTKRQDSDSNTLDATTDTASLDPSPASDADAFLTDLSSGMSLDIGDIGKDFNFDAEDWMFWDQLIQQHQQE
ncbi:hypothetical protein G7Z17_g269 [Cylindrodendrum hubeiense]|uniref:Zn(2)-C6 fungal-type domain-containing protein n=1 Tax=Cylindrodendrum hubeiense TaxID=595255 RepID=A0A9P5LNC3_9HYPO|nr:hypothetical protein G7Z17_g269 [Cylindrodendrum hubeiense]